MLTYNEFAGYRETIESLRQQLAERETQVTLLRDGIAMAVSIIGHPDDDGTKHLQKILATTGPKEQEE